MTSRDFGIVTLRNAVAYHFDGSIVPINNVYITSTNGGAVFSDTLTISTINVSTINGGGVGGGGVSSISSGINISITGTVSTPIVNVDINSTLLMNGFPIVDTTGLLTLSSIGGNISITTSLPGTSIVNNIELNNATGIAISTLGPAGAPISLPIALNASGDINLTAFGNINTYSFNNTTVAASNIINLSTLSTSIVLDQASQSITLTANNDININASTLINGTIKVASTFYDNNASSGTSGQVLTAGTGGQVVWSTISGGNQLYNSIISTTQSVTLSTLINNPSITGSVCINILAIGGGGGGGTNSFFGYGGGGGGSGQEVYGSYYLPENTSLSITIGNGGASDTNGTATSVINSTNNVYIYASGGLCGTISSGLGLGGIGFYGGGGGSGVVTPGSGGQSLVVPQGFISRTGNGGTVGSGGNGDGPNGVGTGGTGGPIDFLIAGGGGGGSSSLGIGGISSASATGFGAGGGGVSTAASSGGSGSNGAVSIQIFAL
jgi:hypothetical protein